VFELNSKLLIMVLVGISLYFVAMHYSNTITIEGLQDTYHQGDEIKFSATIEGFGDGVTWYSVEFYQTERGVQSLPGSSVGGDNVSYLNFPTPFKETIEHSVDTKQHTGPTGTYTMSFSAVGHTVEKTFTLLP
jgi:hypothetical protein